MKITLLELKSLIKDIINEGETKKKKFPKINKKYTHFMVNKKTGKIHDAWDYRNDEPEDIREYYKQDFKEKFEDEKMSDYSLKTKEALMKQGIDPFDAEKNWHHDNA